MDIARFDITVPKPDLLEIAMASNNDNSDRQQASSIDADSDSFDALMANESEWTDQTVYDTNQRKPRNWYEYLK